MLALLLVACGGGNTVLIGSYAPAGSYLISGKLSGLPAGQQTTLLINGTDPIMLSSAGVFTFTHPIALNGSYSVTIGTQPAGETCTVSGGSGAGVTANISSIIVTCSNNTLSIGGTVSGLGAGQHVSLLNNGADALTVAANGAFQFSTLVAYNSSYAVTVGAQPAGETCTVTGGSGAGVTASISRISVTCSARTFSIGGSVSGLAEGQQVTLDNNGADPITLTANGAFAFATPVVYDGSFAITVGTQPTAQTCSVSGASGAGVTAGISSVVVTCSTTPGYTISGTISGLTDGMQVTLSNNGADATTLDANGAFSFATRVVFDGSYAITVGTQPVGQTCTVSGGAGAGVTADVSGITVSCSTNTFTISGSVSGLAADEQVTLFNNTNDATTVTANGAFMFDTAVVYDSGYSVTVGTEPTGQTCSISGGSGTGVTANITAVTVTCSTTTFAIGGTVSGLADGVQVTLDDNVSDARTVTANGAFTFATALPFNGSYAVTVGTQPTGQTCSVTGGSGSGVTAAITAVSVNCSTNTFVIGGTVAGLTAGQQVTLDDNISDSHTITANGAFTFTTAVAYNGSYSVTVGTQPTQQTCTVTGGSGSGVTAAITAVTVNCSIDTFLIGGTVAGLTVGQQVTLDDNVSDSLTVTANGAFTFPTAVAYNGSYAVTVGTEPTAQTCSVSGSGGSGVTANIASVAVSCSTNTFTVGGSLSGLAGSEQVTLLDNLGDSTTVSANGAFTLAGTVVYGGSYSVTVGTQPVGQTCTVSGASGTLTAAVTTVTVACSTNTFMIGGSISGLGVSLQITLLNNGSNATTLYANGAFTFSTQVAYGGSYAVTVGTQPVGQSCTVTSGSGNNVTGNITGIGISCVASPTYSVSGAITGIPNGLSLTLENNGANPVVYNANASYTFLTGIAQGGSYSLTVSAPPDDAGIIFDCYVTHGASANVTANVANAAIACYPP